MSRRIESRLSAAEEARWQEEEMDAWAEIAEEVARERERGSAHQDIKILSLRLKR
jgi:hypothetical protein